MSNELTVGKVVDRAPGLRTYIGQLNVDPNFERPSLMPRGGDRKLAVAAELRRVNQNIMNQAAPTLDALKAAGLIKTYEVNPLTNTVIFDVPEARAAEAWPLLNKVEGMGRIIRNREVQLVPFEDALNGAAMTPLPTTNINGQEVEWNITKMNVPEVWKQGYTGKGVVVGIIDTGVDVKHPALASKYRGAGADGTVNHSYNFFDAVNGRKDAYDDHYHGTHVAGTVVGSTADHVYGMAPDAQIIATKILSASGGGTIESVTKGLEWMLAPRDENGANPDPSKAPDIVNNSWGTTNGKLDVFRKIWKSYVAAGIEPIVAAGNSGPRRGSVGAPGSYPESITIGATDDKDAVAGFSSRGPSPIKSDAGSDRKPDVSAPGHKINSTVPGGGTKVLSGTSMATPGVSGVAALMLSKYKDLTHEEM